MRARRRATACSCSAALIGPSMDRRARPFGEVAQAYGVRTMCVMCHPYVIVDLIQMGEDRVGGADLRKLQAVGSSP
ncbi:hypothetical protein ASF50_01595 [Nocardioides sp. Leaf307]|nr:hypothetical protein ASF50_01595 [Nocardioides sp. Leaf307]